MNAKADISGSGALDVADEADLLKGADKAAILLLALGKEHASKVLKLFDPDELKIVARSLANLKPVPASTLADLVEDFAQVYAGGTDFVSTMADVESLLSDVMTEEQIAQAMSNGEPAPVVEEPPWGELEELKDGVLQTYLAGEHAQTIAFCLAQVDPDLAAAAITKFPEAEQSGIVCRMLDIKDAGIIAKACVERTLREDLLTVADSGHAGIANLLNKLEKPQTDHLLESIASSRPEDAKKLKSMLFAFEDVVLLKLEDRNKLFETVPMDQVTLALTGTDAEFQEPVLSCLGARARRMAEAELKNGANVTPEQVMTARRAIVSTVLDMIARGEITRSTEAGEE